ncbi:MAG: TIGR01777 family protein [Colwellia sp.]|uniref:TIGR01777 family oxidoreductase n=1 Tax=Colwellia sp. TaxID=56799 RepID=UPI0025B820D2|nr:TIGR01777 family oxidoreductase [Colwellia sp.]NQZ25672.1 TIGR01777 family protein [Colwellia sp.]
MNILITGGTGLIGRHFIKSFQQPYQFTVLTRNCRRAKKVLPEGVDFIEELPEQNNFEVIINLAGEPIVDKRWTVMQKEKICQSRWQITEQVTAMIERSKFKPTCLISGSAIGYYGETGNVSTHEDAQVKQEDFAHSLCKKWEDIALKASEHCRVVLLRTGVVLANDGGALTKMRWPFTLGLGGKLGHGQQYMSWIHIEDMVHAIQFIILTPSIEGAINCTSPQALTNEEFTKSLGKQLHRATWFSVPEFILNMLMGQGAELLLSSQNIYPQKLLNHEFDFNHSNLEQTLGDLL